MPAPTERTPAFVLRSVAYGEADRIVTLLTASKGRVSALARGARRSRKRFGGALEPYALLEVELGAGRGQLARLAGATVTRANAGILTSLERMGAAGAALTWTRELGVDGQPDPDVFALVHEVLADLAAPGVHARKRVLVFQARLLALHGLAPQLDACAVSGDPCPPGRAAYFDPSRGAIVRRRHAGQGHLLLSAPARAGLRTALAGEGAEEPPWSDAVQSEVSAVLRAHVRAQLGKDLGGADVLARGGASPRR